MAYTNTKQSAHQTRQRSDQNQVIYYTMLYIILWVIYTMLSATGGYQTRGVPPQRGALPKGNRQELWHAWFRAIERVRGTYKPSGVAAADAAGAACACC